MPRQLASAPPTDATRAAHDRHDHRVVVLVVAVLAVYTYLFTNVASVVGVPSPQDVFEAAGIRSTRIFEHRHVDSAVSIAQTHIQASRQQDGLSPANDDEMLLAFFAIATAAFVAAYYAPLRHKTNLLVAFTVIALGLLFGVRALAELLAAHLLVFVVLHPGPYVPAAVRRWLGHPVIGPIVRTGVVQSAVIVVLAAAVVQGLGGGAWRFPAGVLLFFWQWRRLIVYHVDYKDGLIPADLSLLRYLSVFFSPGAISNWNWGSTVALGYSYLDQKFYARDKNRIVLGGVRLLLVALVYLVSWNVVTGTLIAAFETMGVPVFRASLALLLKTAAAGAHVGAASVLSTSLLELVRFTMIWCGVFHFMVAVWRLYGYDLDPYFDRPWLATNLVAFWSRFTFHYREFLVRAFYYPFFFRFFRGHPTVRVVMATVFAAGFANLLWGHLPFGLFTTDRWDHFQRMLSKGPYFLLLGLGIGLTQLYLLKVKRRRKPWRSFRRAPLDVLAVYGTWQFYALIHVLAYFDYPLSLRARVFLAAFGIDAR